MITVVRCWRVNGTLRRQASSTTARCACNTTATVSSRNRTSRYHGVTNDDVECSMSRCANRLDRTNVNTSNKYGLENQLYLTGSKCLYGESAILLSWRDERNCNHSNPTRQISDWCLSVCLRVCSYVTWYTFPRSRRERTNYTVSQKNDSSLCSLVKHGPILTFSVEIFRRYLLAPWSCEGSVMYDTPRLCVCLCATYLENYWRIWTKFCGIIDQGPID